jgi:hypothetical protein
MDRQFFASLAIYIIRGDISQRNVMTGVLLLSFVIPATTWVRSFKLCICDVGEIPQRPAWGSLTKRMCSKVVPTLSVNTQHWATTGSMGDVWFSAAVTIVKFSGLRLCYLCSRNIRNRPEIMLTVLSPFLSAGPLVSQPSSLHSSGAKVTSSTETAYRLTEHNVRSPQFEPRDINAELGHFHWTVPLVLRNKSFQSSNEGAGVLSPSDAGGDDSRPMQIAFSDSP